MMRGHNAPFRPRIPGTDLTARDVPTAIIYRPARRVTGSGPRPDYWILEFEPARAPQIEPLMGHVSSDDPYRPIRLKFPDRDSAVDFALRQDWPYVVREDRPARPVPARRRGEERHRLYKGADAPNAYRIGAPLPGGSAHHRLHRAADTVQDGAQDSMLDPALDPVLEADLESFPASDPPAWTGATVGAIKGGARR